MDIYIGADHRGFAVKKELVAWLQEQGHTIHDMGATNLNTDDDYPEIGFAVAQAVAGTQNGKGIVVCGSGIGITVAANKVKGIRAGVAANADIAKSARLDDDMNVIGIAADHTSLENAKQIVTAFITTPFSQEERHIRRRDAISAFENK